MKSVKKRKYIHNKRTDWMQKSRGTLIFDWDGFLNYYNFQIKDIVNISRKKDSWIRKLIVDRGLISETVKNELEVYCKNNYGDIYISLDKFNFINKFIKEESYGFRWVSFLKNYELKARDISFMLDQSYSIIFNKIKKKFIHESDLKILSSYCIGNVYYTPVRSYII